MSRKKELRVTLNDYEWELFNKYAENIKSHTDSAALREMIREMARLKHLKEKPCRESTVTAAQDQNKYKIPEWRKKEIIELAKIRWVDD